MDVHGDRIDQTSEAAASRYFNKAKRTFANAARLGMYCEVGLRI
jgi:hypothetical protein